MESITVTASPKTKIAVGEFTLDRGDERLWGPGGQVRLGNKAFLVLSRLVEDPGRLVTKDELFSSVWDGTIVSESALTSVIKELRRALSDDRKAPRYIQSVYGRGYRLVEPVREFDDESDGATRRQSSPAGPGAGGAEGASGYPPLLYLPAFDEEALRQSHPWLGGVIREEVLLALSRFRDFRLVSDSGAGKERPVARPYGERDYQLDISLLNDGSSIRVFAKMLRLANQEIIWAERQRLDAGQPAQDIDALTRRIAAAVLPSIVDDVTRHLSPRADDAYSLYLQNKLAMRAAESLDEMKAVAGQWEALLSAHPNFGQAYPPLIRLYNTDYGYTGLGTTTGAERSRAYALARKAQKIDPSEPYLHTVSAWCHLWAGEAALAVEHLNKALELNPFHGDRLLEVATALMFVGDLDQAADLVARCETLTPFATDTPHEEAGLLHLLAGQYEEAADCLSRVTSPTISSQLYGLLAAGAAGSSDFEVRARQWVERTQQRWSGSAPPDAQALSRWVLYHHPFQDDARRQWVLELLEPALSSALSKAPRIPPPAHREGSSGPKAAGQIS